MTATKYGEYVSSSWSNLDRYNEDLSYDLHGNILTLNRHGYISAGNYNVIDNLTYTFHGSRIEPCEHRKDATNSNRVSIVADASGSTLGFPAASGAYTYDANACPTPVKRWRGNQISNAAMDLPA